MANINKLFNGRNDAIKFADDYDSMILEAERKAAEEESEPEPSKAKTKRKKIALNCEKNDDEKVRSEQIFKEYFFIILYYF